VTQPSGAGVLTAFEGDRGLLREDQAGFDTPAGSFPDGTYGWVKFMGEHQFKVAADAGLITARSARIFTAYDAVNVGASTHHSITAFADMVFDIIGWHPGMIDRQMDRPVGVANRASGNAKMRAAFGWEPSIGLRDGIHRTLCWYEALPTHARTQAELDQRLFAR
jgi:nucleoside-diphosphate-sugar epimerase